MIQISEQKFHERERGTFCRFKKNINPEEENYIKSTKTIRNERIPVLAPESYSI